ncbi:Uncharacterized metallophosphoesterase Cj0846 [uncultured Clostridium sp.]|uniref:metallophosphoesterase n=1 Tax=uncultured Clostridium sp. TaxID=59620 RepID=UPI0008206390|nr:metallophosphoesterase [uncultured Clostridium sp.]SCI89037.1 Uncharacterized metallophosphoesterase Cj0846 [uncultured Clostridium sp.]
MNLLIWGGVTLSAYGFCHYQNNSIEVTRFNIHSNINDNIRILQLSDLHSKEFGKSNRILLDKVFSEKPDIVVATGDLIDSNMKKIDNIVWLLAKINNSIPVFYIPGNNEMRCKKLNEILHKLNVNNVSVLDNEIRTIKIKSTIVNVLGLVENRVDDGELFYEKIKSKYESDKSTYLLNRLEKMNGVRILLSHYPENYEANEDIYYSKYKFDIMFSGHAHGGQFILPFIGGLFAPGQGILPKYYSGMYGKENKLVVSRGLGNSGFPLRLFNRPNIVVVDILRK